MKIQIFYLLVLACIITSCTSSLPPNYRALNNSMMNVDNNMKKLTLGMTKQEVILILGEHYEIVSSQAKMVTLGYKSYDYGIYKLLFIDDKLVEWNKEWLPQRYQDTSSYYPDNKTDPDATIFHLGAHRKAVLGN